MLKTQNYGFNKPELSDSPPDITVMNSNWDNIDKKIKENTDAIAQNREIIGTVKTEITKMDMSWDKISGKPNSFVPSAHSHTKSDIGLGSVQNYGVATQAQVDEGKANNLYVTPLSLAGLKQSVVNGKQTVVNAINDSLGYNSGLTTINSHDDYAWWIKNKVRGLYFNSIVEKYPNMFDGNVFPLSTYAPGSMNSGAILEVSIPTNKGYSSIYLVKFRCNVNVYSGTLYLSVPENIIIPSGKLYKSREISFSGGTYWALPIGTYTDFSFMIPVAIAETSGIRISIGVGNPRGIIGINDNDVTFSIPKKLTDLKIYEIN